MWEASFESSVYDPETWSSVHQQHPQHERSSSAAELQGACGLAGSDRHQWPPRFCDPGGASASTSRFHRLSQAEGPASHGQPSFDATPHPHLKHMAPLRLVASLPAPLPADLGDHAADCKRRRGQDVPPHTSSSKDLQLEPPSPVSTFHLPQHLRPRSSYQHPQQQQHHKQLLLPGDPRTSSPSPGLLHHERSHTCLAGPLESGPFVDWQAEFVVQCERSKKLALQLSLITTQAAQVSGETTRLQSVVQAVKQVRSSFQLVEEPPSAALSPGLAHDASGGSGQDSEDMGVAPMQLHESRSVDARFGPSRPAPSWEEGRRSTTGGWPTQPQLEKVADTALAANHGNPAAAMVDLLHLTLRRKARRAQRTHEALHLAAAVLRSTGVLTLQYDSPACEPGVLPFEVRPAPAQQWPPSGAPPLKEEPRSALSPRWEPRPVAHCHSAGGAGGGGDGGGGSPFRAESARMVFIGGLPAPHSAPTGGQPAAGGRPRDAAFEWHAGGIRAHSPASPLLQLRHSEPPPAMRRAFSPTDGRELEPLLLPTSLGTNWVEQQQARYG